MVLDSWLFWLCSISLAFFCGAVVAWLLLSLLVISDTQEISREYSEWIRKQEREIDYE